MKLSRTRALASTCAVMIGIGSAVFACSDSPSTPKPWRDDAVMTPPIGISATAVRLRADLHGRNQHDAVGLAHNRLLDDLRKELRKPGHLTNNLCEYALAFLAADGRIPSAARLTTAQRRQLAAKGAGASRLCTKSLAWAVSPASHRWPIVPQESPELMALSGQIESAIDLSANSYDLAARLTPVVDAAATLPEIDNAIVLATVSVAQSSFEYWETQYTSFESEFNSEYGDCLINRRDSGYSEEAARDSCLGGTSSYQTFWSWPTAPRRSSLLVNGRRAKSCGPGLRAGFTNIAKSDAKGAFSGAFSGGMTLGVHGAIGGAIIGGSGASIWAAGENAWSTFWCLMR
jgi:hypothetical protein